MTDMEAYDEHGKILKGSDQEPSAARRPSKV
jgi:hypothetical protein